MITPEMVRLSKALRIIKALIAGNDANGAPINGDSVFHDPDVIRALVIAASTLENAEARAQRRSALPQKVGQSWTDDEEEHLRREFEKGLNVEEIAEAHGRTVRAIELRAVTRGWMKASDRKTDNTFNAPVKKKRKRK